MTDPLVQAALKAIFIPDPDPVVCCLCLAVHDARTGGECRDGYLCPDCAAHPRFDFDNCPRCGVRWSDTIQPCPGCGLSLNGQWPHRFDG